MYYEGPRPIPGKCERPARHGNQRIPTPMENQGLFRVMLCRNSCTRMARCQLCSCKGTMVGDAGAPFRRRWWHGRRRTGSPKHKHMSDTCIAKTGTPQHMPSNTTVLLSWILFQTSSDLNRCMDKAHRLQMRAHTTGGGLPKVCLRE